jgi:hypothetical protein
VAAVNPGDPRIRAARRRNEHWFWTPTRRPVRSVARPLLPATTCHCAEHGDPDSMPR